MCQLLGDDLCFILSGVEPRKRCLVHELGTPGRRVFPHLENSDSPADNIFFQIKFFEIQNVNESQNEKIPWRHWKTGKLYSDRDDLSQGFASGSMRVFIESSYTLQGVAPLVVQDASAPAKAEHWTMLEIRPITFTQSNPDLFSLEGIEPLLEAILIEKVAYLKPDYHDTLLVDDEALFTLEEIFLGNLDTQSFGLETDPTVLENLTVYQIQARLNELETITQKFRGKIEEVMYLRDGLFNASAVMETRASTRLNQNLRLLTFVSIFFLPLSFCMSVWSINN
ncbi:hypothetical protein EAF04_004994 [Stromatinia cepivora]|nr:hypothetical protein EAF04_004994 [Stromatinia cepivora]